MANLSYIYYKGYYEGFNDWDNINLKDDRVRKRIANFFAGKNVNFTEMSLTSKARDTTQVQLKTVYPGLLYGSGYTHETGAAGEFKLGFQLDYTTGLPIIAGSSVKGTIRSVFPQFPQDSDKRWEIDYNPPKDKKQFTLQSKAKALHLALQLGWINNDKLLELYTAKELTNDAKALYTKVHELELTIFEGMDINACKASADNEECYFPISKRDIFHDAEPIKGGKNDKIFGTDSITPHGSNPLKNPIPLLFLKVLPQVTFEFRFQFNCPIFHGINENIRKALYTDILKTVGIGAKTNVGYGQLE